MIKYNNLTKISFLFILLTKNIKFTYSAVYEFSCSRFEGTEINDNAFVNMQVGFSDPINHYETFFPVYNWRKHLDNAQPEGIYVKHVLNRHKHEVSFVNTPYYFNKARFEPIPIIYEKDGNELPIFNINFSRIYEPIEFELQLKDFKDNEWTSKKIFVDKTESIGFKGSLNKYDRKGFVKDEAHNSIISLAYEKAVAELTNDISLPEEFYNQEELLQVLNKNCWNRVIQRLVNDKTLGIVFPSREYVEEQVKQEFIKIKQELSTIIREIKNEAQTEKPASITNRAFNTSGRAFNINPFNPKWGSDGLGSCFMDMNSLKSFGVAFYPCDPTKEKVLFHLDSFNILDGQKVREALHHNPSIDKSLVQEFEDDFTFYPHPEQENGEPIVPEPSSTLLILGSLITFKQKQKQKQKQ